MQFLFELAPVIAFVVAYVLGGIYVATATIMVAMAGHAGSGLPAHAAHPDDAWRSAPFWCSVFGAATLILHDKRFIQWKPTVFYWLVSVCLLGSLWIGKQPLLQRLMSAALEGAGALRVSDTTWRRANVVCAVFTCCSASPTARWRSTRARRPG